MEKLIYSTFREGYGIDQIRKTMTVGELISFLENYDVETPVYLSFDNGYTYGEIGLRNTTRMMKTNIGATSLKNKKAPYRTLKSCKGLTSIMLHFYFTIRSSNANTSPRVIGSSNRVSLISTPLAIRLS